MSPRTSDTSTSKTAGLVTYPLEYAALGLLMRGPQHGYGLYQEFQTEFDLIWKSGQAAFYAALAAIEDRGLVTAHAEPQEGRPARKVYELTEFGREAFETWLRQPVHNLRAFRVEFIARMKFFSLLKLPGAGLLIDQQSTVLMHLLREWDHTPNESGDLFTDAVNGFRRYQAEAMLDWLIVWRERLETAHGA